MKPTCHILILFLLCFFLNLCEKSNSENPSENHFRIEEKTTRINTAALVKLRGNRLLNDMKAVLMASEGIEFASNQNQVLKITGAGSLMGFIIHSKKQEELTNGDYFINLRPPFEEGDIAVGFYTLNWNEKDIIDFYEKVEGASLLAGKVSVLQKKDFISLTFSFTDEQGKILSGIYNGPLQKNLIYPTDHIDLDNQNL